MSWSGGIANREWNRAAGAANIARISAQRARQLYETQAGNRFYCESCGGFHPLREHRVCRAGGAS